ncbi:hypothetical protein CWO91_16520 [Bradyrhizobium genosp. SA-3]|uniref:hypothetical protein n=1 Tax=Bradyrhizobium genosp. SA-3 TaxID=508868 RepID=UPI001029F983|nr:hypothetical protein [Bradyrhizobium genosp. SA-3]RZN09632.1 hypothetical protein CWO91_16520 [Bradyrhizobium genosp. SA-3]
MADEKVTQKVTAPATTPAPKKFATVVEDAPKPKPPALNEKTRAEQAAGRAALAAYGPVPNQE